MIAKPARFGFFASAKSLVQNVWNRGAGSKAPSNIPVTKSAQPKEETKALSKKSAAIAGSSGAPPLGSQTKRIPSGSSNISVQSGVPGRSTLAPPVISGEGGGTATSSRIWKSSTPSLNAPSPSVAANPRSSTIAGYGQSNNRGSPLVGFSSLGMKPALSTNDTRVSSMGAKSNIRASLQKHTATIPRSRTSSTLMAPTASSLAKTNSNSRIPVSVAENSTLTKASTSSKQQVAMSPQSNATLDILNSPQSSPLSARPAKVFSQPLSPPPTRIPMSLTAAATSIVGQAPPDKSTLKPPVPPKAKVLPGRRPRISRSKVIARLASQREGGAGSGSGSGSKGSTATGRAGGKVRSSMGAGVAGKTRQSYGGARGGDMLMSAKKRIRQSEHARRSRATARMDVD